MAKGKSTNIQFVCTECGITKKHSATTFNPTSKTGKKKVLKDLKLKKFCSKDRKHTLHIAKQTPKGKS